MVVVPFCASMLYYIASSARGRCVLLWSNQGDRFTRTSCRFASMPPGYLLALVWILIWSLIQCSWDLRGHLSILFSVIISLFRSHKNTQHEWLDIVTAFWTLSDKNQFLVKHKVPLVHKWSKKVQKGPKWSPMVTISVCVFWAVKRFTLKTTRYYHIYRVSQNNCAYRTKS